MQINIVEDVRDGSADRDSLDIVQLLHGVQNLPLSSIDVNNENQCVVILNLFHGRLGCQGVLDNSELVQSSTTGDRPARVLGVLGGSEGLWSSEDGGGADLLEPQGLLALLNRFLGLEGSLDLGGLLGNSLGRLCLGNYSLRLCHCLSFVVGFGWCSSLCTYILIFFPPKHFEIIAV